MNDIRRNRMKFILRLICIVTALSLFLFLLVPSFRTFGFLLFKLLLQCRWVFLADSHLADAIVNDKKFLFYENNLSCAIIAIAKQTAKKNWNSNCFHFGQFSSGRFRLTSIISQVMRLILCKNAIRCVSLGLDCLSPAQFTIASRINLTLCLRYLIRLAGP